jgi:integrase/recombinase XerD
MHNSVRVERKTHDVLEPQDVDAFISIIRSRTPLSRTTNICRDVAIVLILYHSGLRVSELCNLHLDDINFTRIGIWVRGKGGRDRFVPTTKECIKAIQTYVNLDRQSDTDIVFVKSDGQRITRRAVTDMLTSLSCRAGIKHTNSHMLRRSCATLLMKRGVDLELVQLLLGHQNLSTTQAYLTVDHDWLMKIHRKCHPFGEKNES